jgi:hypothetical protein
MKRMMKKFQPWPWIKKGLIVLAVGLLFTAPSVIILKPTPVYASCNIGNLKGLDRVRKIGKKIKSFTDEIRGVANFIGDQFGRLAPLAEMSSQMAGITNSILGEVQIQAQMAENEVARNDAKQRKENIKKTVTATKPSALECETASAHAGLTQASEIQRETAKLEVSRFTRRVRSTPTPAKQINDDFRKAVLFSRPEDDAGALEEIQKEQNNGQSIPPDVTRAAQRFYSEGLLAPDRIDPNPFLGKSNVKIPEEFRNEADIFKEIYDFQCRNVIGGIDSDRAPIPAEALTQVAGREAALKNTVHDIRKLQLWSFCNGYLKENKSPTVESGRWLRGILRKGAGISEAQAERIADAENTTITVNGNLVDVIDPLNPSVINTINGLNIDEAGKDYLIFIQENYPNVLSKDQFMDGMLNARFKGTGWFTGQIASSESTARVHNQLFAQSLMQQRHTHQLLEFLTQFLMMDVAMDLEGARP